MPSRSDVYEIAKRLALQAGAKTVWRGYFYPEMEVAAGLMYPVIGIAEQEPEMITPGGNAWAVFEGTLLLQIWLNTGDVFGPNGDTAWRQMDDMHDALVRSFSLYFAGDGGPSSQTTAFLPKQCDYHYWYQNLPYLGADFRVDYKLNFA